MPNTPRMQWPYPSENQDPWYEALVAFFEAADASSYAQRENSNILLSGGGDVTFDDATGVLEWTSAIDVFSPYTGFNLSIAAGEITLADGQVLYAELLRAPTAAGSLTLTAASRLPVGDGALLLAIRRGTYVYWRNGALVTSGETLSPLAGSGSGGGGGGGVTGAANIGGAANLFSSNAAGSLQFRTISGLEGITAAVSGNVVQIRGNALYDTLVYDSGGAQTGNTYTDFDDLIAEVTSRARATRVLMRTDATLTTGTYDLTYAEFECETPYTRPQILATDDALLTGTRLWLKNVDLINQRAAGEAWAVDSDGVRVHLDGYAILGVVTQPLFDLDGNNARVWMRESSSLDGNNNVPVFAGAGNLSIFAYENTSATADIAPDTGVVVTLYLNRIDGDAETFVTAFANLTAPPIVHRVRDFFIEPTQITADEDDYDPPLFASAREVYVDQDAAHAITGFGNNDGGTLESSFVPFKILANESAFDLTIPHEDAGSTAEMRVTTQTGDAVVIPPNGLGFLLYSHTAQRWRLLVQPEAGGGGAGLPGTTIDETLTTADNTPTTIYTYTPTGASMAVGFNLHVIGAQTDDYCQFIMSGMFKTDITSVPTERDVTYINGPYREDLGLNVSFSIDAPDIEIQVTGLAADSVNWRITGNVIEVAINGGGGGGA